MQGVRTYKRFACDITDKEAKELSKLVSSGAIYNLYTSAKKNKLNNCLFICKEVGTTNIVGWSIICKKKGYRHIKYEFMIYIKRKYRRRGVGTSMYRRAKLFFKLKDEDITVYRTDNGNEKFFDKIRTHRD